MLNLFSQVLNLTSFDLKKKSISSLTILGLEFSIRILDIKY